MRELLTGARGGKYYINDNGDKVYKKSKSVSERGSPKKNIL
jgi:hypothetical protein